MERRSSVLIVDDEVLIAEHLRLVVEEHGFRVAGVAYNAAKAMALAEAAQPVAAVVDIKLGPDDGIQLAQRLQADLGMRVVFVSGSGDPATRARVDAVRPVGFLQKPFRPPDLAELVRKALAAG